MVVTRGEIIDNRTKLQEMFEYTAFLIELHDLALHSWKVDIETRYIPQKDMDELFSRYKTLKPQLETKYGELL